MKLRPIDSLLGLAFVLLVTTLVLILFRSGVPDAPRVDPSETPVIPTSEFLNARASIDFYRDHLRKAPDDLAARVALAQVYLQQAASTAQEARYVPAAREQLAAVLAADPDHYHALVLQGQLYNKLHRFEDAEAVARDVIARHPAEAFPYGILVDALVELGRYDEAVAACDSMLALRPSLASYARAAYLRELHGRTEDAVAAMELAAGAGVAGTESRAWALYQLALLHLGAERTGVAERIFNGILEERPGYEPAVSGLAHLRHLAGEHEDAVRLLQQAYATHPSPAYLERLLDVYRTVGDSPRAKATVEALRASYEEAAGFGEDVDLEYADFLADEDLDLQRALDLAASEMERRPTHFHTLETFAWALYKNGRADEAVAPIERVVAQTADDPMLRYRAGLIRMSTGDTPAARRHLEAARSNGLRTESLTADRDARALLETLTD